MMRTTVTALALAVTTAAPISGVNVGGWYLIEEWMFSNGLFDGVAESSDTPQGVVMPPMLPEGFGEFWYAEGDLVNKLVDKYGDATAVDIITAHRDEYITDDDMALMKANGIEQVRLPIGWWAFADESYGTNASAVIADPAHADRKFVTVPTARLAREIARFAAAGLSVLLDIHAYPGGSASGSYNGVFPSTPVFFLNDTLLALGDRIVARLCAFVAALPDGARAAVGGVTIMNEPCHQLSEQADAMLAFLAKAVATYRADVVDALAARGDAAPPTLFVQLIETCVSQTQMLEFMLANFDASELASWAVLDLHHYYAWNAAAAGCVAGGTDGEGRADPGDCKYACGDADEALDPSGWAAAAAVIEGEADAWYAWVLANGSVPLYSCSEYSLATYYASARACRGAAVLGEMYAAQRAGFGDGMHAHHFWTWRMPYGGAHEAGWSLKHYLTGEH